MPARCDLARFYLARDMIAEAKAVLDVALADNPPTAEDSTPVVLRAIANIMIGRPDAALKDLANPFVGNQHDAPLWRALAHARLGKWAEAREGFRNAEAAMRDAAARNPAHDAQGDGARLARGRRHHRRRAASSTNSR